MFYNSCGEAQEDILAHITPNDLLLFKTYPNKYYNILNRQDCSILCKLIDTQILNEKFYFCSMPIKLQCWAMQDERDDYLEPPCYICHGKLKIGRDC